jgi:hypothetical protein
MYFFGSPNKSTFDYFLRLELSKLSSTVTTVFAANASESELV